MHLKDYGKIESTNIEFKEKVVNQKVGLNLSQHLLILMVVYYCLELEI